MKKIFSLLFAILFAVGTTGVFTSCQEDAPEINYTISVTVNNDFTEVVNAINNGTMKQEAAIAALTAAINGMNGEQNAKIDAIVKAINDLAKTTDAKLTIIEAAMKAQTLALEAKLALLETAIESLPDYRDQLTAIKDAIPSIPDYSAQITALETALEAIAANIKAQEGQYADELEALKSSIDAISKAVEAGNKSEAEAMDEIIAMLARVADIPYVTFTAAGTQKLQMNEDVPTLEYSVDGGTTWQLLGTNEVAFGGTTKLLLRGMSSVGTNGATISFETDAVKVTCTGDIRTLVDYDNYMSANTSAANFNSLFNHCTSLVTAPELPATELAERCYASMFEHCTSLVTAPELPATELADYCYANMFYHCTALKTAPELPATELADYCYASMFDHCTALETAPELPAATLADYCYYHMFYECTALNNVTMLATNIDATDCLTDWLVGVSASGTFTKSASATWTEDGVIPTGWTVETK